MAEPAAHNGGVAGSSPAGPTKRRKNAHTWDRHPRDWYVEPAWCSDVLLRGEDHGQAIWDPAAGMGTIVKTARALGFDAFGSDVEPRDPIIDRWDFFLTDPNTLRPMTIVSNPPFNKAQEFVELALRCSRRTMLLLPSAWVQGERRVKWLRTTPLREVRFICPRPSMPPGEVVLAGEKPGNGERDYAWFIWEEGYAGKPTVGWCVRTA